MTDPPLSTMAAPAAATPSRAIPTAHTTPTDTNAPPVTKSLVTRDFDLVIRAFFPVPTAPAKFNPTSAMQHLLRIMIKDEPSLVLRTPRNDQQIVLATMPLPVGEKAFKQFCTVSTPRSERQNQNHVCIGCHVLSNRTLGNIKFQSKENHLLAWLKKAKVFLESDSLGIERPVTIGYFTKLDPTLTHLANFHNDLVNQLMLVEIETETAVNLAPFLKKAQIEAMSNGDEYIPILPNFEVYKTRLSHGRAPSQTMTEVIGVKGAPKDAQLLGEFFMRLASETSNDPRNGVFLPKGAATMLGAPTYEQVLKDNNVFLHTLATIPVNLEHAAWFAIIDPNQQSESEPVTLYDHLIRQPWFFRLEPAGRKKCILIVNRFNLPEARTWIDENLQRLICKSIPPDSVPPESSLPRRLDKPVNTATRQSYADILKKQFSLENSKNDTTTANNTSRPPRKRQATLLDYDSDNQAEYPPLAGNAANSSNATTQPTAYAAELTSIKAEISELKTILATLMEQFKTAIASLTAPPNTTSNEMETENSQPTAPNTPTPTPPDLSALILDLKNEIADFARDTKALLQQDRRPFTPIPMIPMPPSIAMLTSEYRNSMVT